VAKVIGSLSALVGANTKGLEKGLKRASRMVRGYAASVGGAGSFITGKVAAIAGAIGIGVSVAGLKNIAEEMDAVAKTADSLGFTTEALIGLQHGARLAGVGTEAFNTSVQTMVKNVGMAAQGTGRARAALAGLNIDAAKLAELTPENQLKVLADAMAKVENPTTRATYAMQIFGGQGAAMINVLNGGAAGLEQMQTEAEKLGLTFSRIDAAKVEAANDSLSRMQAVFTGLAQTLVIQLSPYIDAAATAFVKWGTDGKGAGDKIITAVEWVAGTVAQLTDVIDYGKIAWYGLKIAGVASLKAMLLPSSMLIKSITKLVDLASDYLPQGLVDAAAQAQAFVDGLDAGLNDVANEAADKIDAIWTGPSRADAVAKYFADVRAKAEEAAQTIAARAPKPEAYSQDLFKGVQTAADAVKAQIADLELEVSEVGSYTGGDVGLIRAGSAEAEAAQAESGFEAVTSWLRRNHDTAKESTRVLKSIDGGISDLVENEDVVVDL
jgi:hypothetical protein